MLSGLIRDESGQDLIEYALVAAIIASGRHGGDDHACEHHYQRFTKIGTSLTNAV